MFVEPLAYRKLRPINYHSWGKLKTLILSSFESCVHKHKMSDKITKCNPPRQYSRQFVRL